MRHFASLGILLIIVGTPIALTELDATLDSKLDMSAIAQSSDDLRSQQITEAVYLKQSGYDRLQKADPQGAIADLQNALDLFRKWNATGGERDTLNFLGDVYLTTGQYEKAIAIFLSRDYWHG